MRRFRFRLDRLLEFKRRQKRLLELNIQKAAGELARARQEIDSVSALLDRYLTQPAKPAPQLSGPTLHVLTALSALKGRWLAALERWQQASQQLDKVAEELRSISRQLDAYETLRLRKREEFKRNQAQKQARWLDEIALRQWQDST